MFFTWWYTDIASIPSSPASLRMLQRREPVPVREGCRGPQGQVSSDRRPRRGPRLPGRLAGLQLPISLSLAELNA